MAAYDAFDAFDDTTRNIDSLDAPTGAEGEVATEEQQWSATKEHPPHAATKEEREPDDRVRCVLGSGASAEVGRGRSGTAFSRTVNIGGGRLAKRFAEALAAERPSMAAWSVTLTTRLNAGSTEFLARARTYSERILARYPTGGPVLSLDRGPEGGRWHLHGVVFVPLPRGWQSLPAEELAAYKAEVSRELRRIWLRLWPKKKGSPRPAVQAQRVRPIPTGPGAKRALTKALKHAIDRHSELEARAKGRKSFRLPNLLDRVVVAGAWAPGLFDQAIRGKAKPTKQAARRRKTAKMGGSCGWCGEKFDELVRRDTRFHRNCGRRASRALQTVVRRTAGEIPAWLNYLAAGFRERRDFDLKAFLFHPASPKGWHVRTWVVELEARGWRRLDALRVVEEAIRIHAWPTLHPLNNPALADVLDCPGRCGKPKIRRLNATSCGAPNCCAKARAAKLKAG